MAVAKYTNGAKVFVEGIEINGVTKFNIAEGWLEAVVESPIGYSNLDQGPDMFVVSRLYGHIEVEYN